MALFYHNFIKIQPHTKRNLLQCAAAFWERICFDIDLFRGMVKGVFPEVSLGLAGDPLAQEIAQDGTAGTHEHKGQHHHAAPCLRVAEQQRRPRTSRNRPTARRKGKNFWGFILVYLTDQALGLLPKQGPGKGEERECDIYEKYSLRLLFCQGVIPWNSKKW